MTHQDILGVREEIRSFRSDVSSRFGEVNSRFNSLESRVSHQFWVSVATLAGVVIGVGGIIATVLLTK